MTTKFRYQALSKKYFRVVLPLVSLICMILVTSCNMQGVTSDIAGGADLSKKVYITMEGGSGKAHIESPVTVNVQGGRSYATLVWNSENYDYIIVEGVKYENENPGGKSTFTIPVEDFESPLKLIGDTTAMSKPHEIEYTITWLDEAPEENETGEKTGKAADFEGGADVSREQFGVRPKNKNDPKIAGMKPTGRMELTYAEGFDITEYGDYRFVCIYGVGDYLLVPEGSDVPGDIPDDITVLKKPLDKTYLVSTSVADLIRQIGALDNIRLSSLRSEDWYIKEAADLMDEGKIIYAGKYRTPDYELILSEGCDLAIENTMIYHDPEVKEKLEELGIPVLVETSSYEKDPLGRLEWIRLYGVLFDRQKEADSWYRVQEKIIGSPADPDHPDKSVAMFYVSATGMINVRAPGDYITKMIEAAGGKYVPGSDVIDSNGGMGTVNMNAEDFYAAVKDADILIYNGTIADEITSVEDLVAKNAIFADMKAVKEGNVYCLGSDFFQKSTGMADFITDMRRVIDGGEGLYTFLTKLNNTSVK